MPVLARLKRRIPANMRDFFVFNKFWDILHIITFIQSKGMLSALIHETYKIVINNNFSQAPALSPLKMTHAGWNM
jgi:hypothetical protein